MLTDLYIFLISSSLCLFLCLTVIWTVTHRLSLTLCHWFSPSSPSLSCSLCLSLIGSILTPLNARALINQCRVALFHRDPKQLVSSPPAAVCLSVARLCLCTWHACMHVSTLWDPAGKRDVRVRKDWMMVHGGFVYYWFAWTIKCIQQHTVYTENVFFISYTFRLDCWMIIRQDWVCTVCVF